MSVSEDRSAALVEVVAALVARIEDRGADRLVGALRLELAAFAMGVVAHEEAAALVRADRLGELAEARRADREDAPLVRTDVADHQQRVGLPVAVHVEQLRRIIGGGSVARIGS